MEKEERFLEDKKMRDESVNHYEVLEKVKKLLLIPEMETMTTQQVADYYKVSLEAIKLIAMRHYDELSEDGVKIEKMENFLKLQDVTFQKERNKTLLSFKNGMDFIVTNRGIKVFPRRAILRVGMLLRDSETAKEIRSQLLNIEEKISDETKVQDITEEQSLAMSLGMAIASGDANAIAIASGKMMDFKNRHITKLETDNKKLQNDNEALANGILEWSDRKQLNFGVRRLASVTHIAFKDVWTELYRQLSYKYGIDLKKRGGGKTPYIEHIKEDEWNNVIKSFGAICQSHNQSPTDMFTLIEAAK